MKALVFLLLVLPPSWSAPRFGQKDSDLDAELELEDGGVHSHEDPYTSAARVAVSNQTKPNQDDVDKDGQEGTESEDNAGKRLGRASPQGEYSESVMGCLKGLNNIAFNGITLEECKSICSAASSFPCNSIDYNMKKRKCHLSTETKRSRPNAYHEPCYTETTWTIYLERKVSCRGGAALLSTSPGRDMVLCKDKTESTCEKDFEWLCPAGWNLCHPKQFNNKNHGWDYNWKDAKAGRPLGVIYCRGSGWAGHYGIQDSNSVLSTDVPLNCRWGSIRPGCEAYAGYGGDCNDKHNSALCCAPTSTCGDGRVQQEEDCDDGNNSNIDDCLNSCTWRKPRDHGLNGYYC